MQMKVTPQTDKYRNDPAYISSSSVDVFDGGAISGTSVNLRTSPSLNTTDNIYENVGKGTLFTLLNDNIQGDSFAGSKQWYKIMYDNVELYVHRSLANINLRVGKAKTGVNIQSAENTTSHVFATVKEGTLLRVLEENGSWYQVSIDNWRNATAADVLEYLDPTKFVNDEKQKFQFLDLSKPSGVSVDVLNNYLKGKGILEGQGQAFIDASYSNSISDLYLISHALLETGHGTSPLAQGVDYNGVKVYNMYGIGAFDDCPVDCGAERAYQEGWTSPYLAIVGGSKFIGEKYIRGMNNYGTIQNTLYEMRWNPLRMDAAGVAGHQYATDIGWASKQINSMYNLYKEVGLYTLNLDIPVYK